VAAGMVEVETTGRCKARPRRRNDRAPADFSRTRFLGMCRGALFLQLRFVLFSDLAAVLSFARTPSFAAGVGARSGSVLPTGFRVGPVDWLAVRPLDTAWGERSFRAQSCFGGRPCVSGSGHDRVCFCRRGRVLPMAASGGCRFRGRRLRRLPVRADDCRAASRRTMVGAAKRLWQLRRTYRAGIDGVSCRSQRALFFGVCAGCWNFPGRRADMGIRSSACSDPVARSSCSSAKRMTQSLMTKASAPCRGASRSGKVSSGDCNALRPRPVCAVRQAGV
jgi:hypothetical protein